MIPPAVGSVTVDDPHVVQGARDRFRLQAKFFFLTWPQCSTPKETVLDRLKALPNFSHALVAREDHKDQAGEHLHAFLALSKPWNIRNPGLLDALAGKHGNYQAAKDQTKVVKYCVKDGDYVSHGFDPAAFLSKRLEKKSTKTSLSSAVAVMIREQNANLDAIDDFAPQYVLANKRKCQEYISYQQEKRLALSKLPWTPIVLDSYTEDDATKEIAKWISENVKQPRDFKQPQLYIYSDGPNVGKTELILQLSKMLRVFNIPKTSYVDGYESNRFDLVVCDEFKAHFTIQFMNEFLQGSQMHLNQKGTGTVKSDNPPMIFLSNLSLEACYHKSCLTGPFEALLSRFTVVHVPRGHKIDVFHTLNQ